MVVCREGTPSRENRVAVIEGAEPALLPMLDGCLPPVFGWPGSSRRDGALTGDLLVGAGSRGCQGSYR